MTAGPEATILDPSSEALAKLAHAVTELDRAYNFGGHFAVMDAREKVCTASRALPEAPSDKDATDGTDGRPDPVRPSTEGRGDGTAEGAGSAADPARSVAQSEVDQEVAPEAPEPEGLLTPEQVAAAWPPLSKGLVPKYALHEVVPVPTPSDPHGWVSEDIVATYDSIPLAATPRPSGASPTPAPSTPSPGTARS